MSVKPRYLITTSDERTWKFDRPVIFLGEWCRLYSRKHIWEKMDAIVAEPYGLSLEDKICDHQEARQVELLLNSKISKILNKENGTVYSERFWKIINGHWVRTFIEAGINRVKTLENCISKYQISGASFIELEAEYFICKNANSFLSLLEESEWNSNFDLKIINLMKDINFPIEIIKSNSHSIKFSYPDENLSIKSQVFNTIKKTANNFVRNKDALIVTTYLPRLEQVKLHLSLGQFPQFWEIEPLELTSTVNLSLREKLSISTNSSIINQVEMVLNSLVFSFFPLAYLEGFAELYELAVKKNWPKLPKFIFTSNNFLKDDVFKIWVASRTEAGIKYFVGQHGNAYGTHRFFSPAVEEETASSFLTWGWVNNKANYIPTFIFKTTNQKAYCNSNGGLLLIQSLIDTRRTTWDPTATHLKYFEDQKNLISNLPLPIKSNTTLRLHASYKKHSFEENLRWLDFDPTLRIDHGEVKINSLFEQNRLVVHCYESTGILETLSMNIPTMAFWQNSFEDLHENVKPYYQILVNVGIVHLTPESIALKICKEWDNIGEWWASKTVQEARVKFCNQFARKTTRPIRELRKILIEEKNYNF